MQTWTRAGFVTVGLIAVTVTAADAQGLWPLGGRNVRNTRHQRGEREIDVVSVASLQVKWAVDTDGDISATPAVDATSVYVPDWAGKLMRSTVALRTLPLVAHHRLDHRRRGDVSAGPLAGNQLRAGHARHRRPPADPGGPRRTLLAGARVFAVDKPTGALKWVTQVDPHFAAIVSQPATVDPRDPRVAYVGVAWMEEALAGSSPAIQCCTFRGSVVALDTQTGRILWKTYTVPNIPGYSGNGVWGSMGAIDRDAAAALRRHRQQLLRAGRGLGLRRRRGDAGREERRVFAPGRLLRLAAGARSAATAASAGSSFANALRRVEPRLSARLRQRDRLSA